MTDYDHSVVALTVGQLRAMLQSRPDEEAIQVFVPDSLGSGETSSRVVTVAQAIYGLVAQTRGDSPTRETYFKIDCDWPSGRYVLD